MKRLLTLIALTGLSSLAAGAAPALAQIPTNGVIYACVRLDRDKDEGKLARIVAADEPCRRNEVKIHWSVTGPAGPTGPTGPTGPAGAAGINGTNGRDGTNAPSGGITGQLTLCPGDTTSLAGVLVHVPGRPYNVWTGADGRFQFDSMPGGMYDVSVERAGAVLASVAGVPVGTTPYALGDVLLDASGAGCAPPPPPACTYELTPPVVNLSSSAASAQTILVTTQSGCVWTTTASDGWMTVSGFGNGPGMAVYSVLENSAGAARTATLTIGGQAVTINQMGATCPLTLQPTDPGAAGTVSGTTITMQAGGGAFAIDVLSSCADLNWTAGSQSSWLSVVPAAGTGNGTVTVTVATLSHSAPSRTGAISINGVIVTVNQIH